MKQTPSWKNTLNFDNAPWGALSDLLNAAASVGYPYALWDDGNIYTYSFNTHNLLVVEPTEFTSKDLEKN